MADAQDKNRVTATELRRRAEARLEDLASRAQLPQTEAETQRLLHELQVHQIELEMQVAELRQAKDDAVTALEMFTDLYDFAPVGYFTLDREGVISAANLSGATLLRVRRSRLLGQRLALFIPVDSRRIFSEFLATVFANPGQGVL